MFSGWERQKRERALPVSINVRCDAGPKMNRRDSGSRHHGAGRVLNYAFQPRIANLRNGQDGSEQNDTKVRNSPPQHAGMLCNRAIFPRLASNEFTGPGIAFPL